MSEPSAADLIAADLASLGSETPYPPARMILHSLVDAGIVDRRHLEAIDNELRRANYVALVTEYSDADKLAPDDYVPVDASCLTAMPRYCLVERSVGERRRYLTLHDARHEAASHHTTQEYMHDWTVEVLVDLDTGERWTGEYDITWTRESGS